MQIDTMQLVHMLYDESKFWLALGGFFWSLFKGISWIKAIRTNDLHHIQLGVNEINASLTKQTDSLLRELGELRNDFRTFYPVRRSPRRSPRRK
jgi:hypothetical protein